MRGREGYIILLYSVQLKGTKLQKGVRHEARGRVGGWRVAKAIWRVAKVYGA